MAGMFFYSLYNLVDAIFIGQYVGSLGIAAISIYFPIHIVILGVSQMFGIGAASIISRNLGAGKPEKANITIGNLIIIILSYGSILALIGNIFSKEIMLLFGSTLDILPYSQTYSRILMSGSVLFAFSVAMNNVIRSEGKAKQAMISMTIGAGLNIFLDAVFILYFKMGISGAAYATLISSLFTVCYQFYFLKFGKTSFHIDKKYFKLDYPIIKETLTIGFSTFIRQASSSLMVILVNNMLKIYGGNLAIATYGIIHRLIIFTFLPLIGIAHGLQPIVGFNYGAKRYDKTQTSLKLALYFTTGLSFIGFLLIFLFPTQLIRIFSKDNTLILSTAKAIRIFILAFPLVGIQFVGSTFFQAIGKIKPAISISLIRPVLLVPFLFILPQFFALNGIWASFPLADLLAFGFVIVILHPYFKKTAPKPAL